MCTLCLLHHFSFQNWALKKRIYVLQVIWTLSFPSCVHHLLSCHWGKRRRLISRAFFPFYWRAVLQREPSITWIVCASLLPVSNSVSLSPSSRLKGQAAPVWPQEAVSSSEKGRRPKRGGGGFLPPSSSSIHPLTTPKWPLTLSSVYIRAWKWEIVMSHSSRVFTLWSHARKEISHGLLKVERWEGCCDLPLRTRIDFASSLLRKRFTPQTAALAARRTAVRPTARVGA